MRPERLRVLVSGMVAGVPGQGGASWAVLQWVLGLRQLGHDVVLVEPVASVEPAAEAYFVALAERFELGGAAALVGPARQTVGISYVELERFARRADVVINVAGMLTDPALLQPVPVRVYLDLDPAFTQLWQAVEGIDMRLGDHSHFVTVGLNLGQPDCPVPTCGVEWIPTLPPVVLDQWPVAGRLTVDGFTTVGNWRGYGSVRQGGVLHGQKAHSWRSFFELASRTAEALVPALSIHPDEGKDIAALDEHGWTVVAPADVAATPDAYRAFVQGSKAELGVAKSGYVLSRSGWFSDRSACYLASGRPVVAQDTGFSIHLPCGAGLFGFATTDEAVEAIDLVSRDYEDQRRRARRIAEEHLDSAVVLPRLLGRVTSTG